MMTLLCIFISGCGREKEELLKNGADYLVDSPEDILDLYEEKFEE